MPREAPYRYPARLYLHAQHRARNNRCDDGYVPLHPFSPKCWHTHMRAASISKVTACSRTFNVTRHPSGETQTVISINQPPTTYLQMQHLLRMEAHVIHRHKRSRKKAFLEKQKRTPLQVILICYALAVAKVKLDRHANRKVRQSQSRRKRTTTATLLPKGRH